MKSTRLIIFSAFVVLASCDGNKEKKQNDSEGDWVKKVVNTDHGPVREKQVTGDFDEIEVSQAIEAEIIKSDMEKVVISAPENIIDDVLVDISGGELHIHYKKGIRVMNNHNVTAKIYAKDFTKIEANSAAGIVVKDKFVQEKTSIEVSSAGSVSGNLEANDFEISAGSSSSFSGKIWAVDLDIDASSGASMNLSGKAKNAEVSSSSGSSISAKNLVADNLKAEASSGASIDISAASSINAEASSGGSIDVSKKGNVTSVTKQENSGGSVSIH
ncbi:MULTISPECIES: head GIN domain-containing protein [unclassified Chryseobacterium]|uniref:head GIN domain-containing protein n=1 Tax=unclassified Chryseobacterium TaxID=2593645 RepID=UPI0021E6257D|nr:MULTISPECIES: head GIN domain-containing protein [unclassified Chryseobacterium]MEA1850370.1 head GIN domain-containing protein [Chryseobacterium sp. MHB01]